MEVIYSKMTEFEKVSENKTENSLCQNFILEYD